MSSYVKSFIYGASLPLVALRLIIRQPSLIFWSSFPIAVTLGLYFYLAERLHQWVAGRLDALITSWGWNPAGAAAWILLHLAAVLLFLFFAVTFSIGASLVASPFNDRLAERAERWAEPPLSEPPHGGPGLRLRLIAIDTVKSLCALCAGLLALVVSWIPGLNLIAVIALCLLVTFQYISYPQTRRGEGVGTGIQFLLLHPASSVAFGGALTLLFAIPLLSCFAIPLAVVGGTLLVARAQRPAGSKLFILR